MSTCYRQAPLARILRIDLGGHNAALVEGKSDTAHVRHRVDAQARLMSGSDRPVNVVTSPRAVTCRRNLTKSKGCLMSWDVMVFNYGGKPPADGDAPPAGPLGPASKVRDGIAAHLPGVDWSDPSWGIFEADEFSIEFNMGDEDPIDSIMLHVRGGGEVLGAIMAFANPNGWSLLDCSTGDFLDPEKPSSAGWEGFQDFRDKVIRSIVKPKGQGNKTKNTTEKPKAKAKKLQAKGKKSMGTKKTAKRKGKRKNA